MVLDREGREFRTKHDLLSHALERKALGLLYVQVLVERKRTPRHWDAIRVFPNLHGRCIGPVTPGRFLVDVRIDDIERAAPSPGNPTEKK